MAKENYAFIIGMVADTPRILQDRSGNDSEAVIKLRTIRRGPYDRAGNFDPKYDLPMMRTRDPRIINIIDGLQVNDVIESKCNIITRHSLTSCTCPYCGTKTVRSFFLTYLNPISIAIRNRCDTETAAMHILNDVDVAENSNVLKIMGRLTNENGPRFYENEATGKKSCIYQIAVNRRFKVYGSRNAFGIKSDGNEDEENRSINEARSDYPWVISYDGLAEENSKYLHMGSSIYIDGYFHTRDYTKTVLCSNPECSRDFEVPAVSLTITPYSVEYLENCDIPEVETNPLDHSQDII